MSGAWTVFRKELLDALRDRRTLLVVLASSVLMGPLVLVLLSNLVAGIEQRADARELQVQGAEHAPTLQNYLERQGYRVRPADADAAQRLQQGRLGDAIVVVAPGFEDALARGQAPVVEVLGHSANRAAQAAANRAAALLRGFNQEQALVRLALRGVSPSLLDAVVVDEHDLADPAARAAQFSFMVPFFVLMAVVYGTLNAALDTTAGERERGSLEPLLMNPLSRAALVLGKWAAVAAVGMLIAVLSCLSLLPGQWLLRSEMLSAMFRFGPHEAVLFIGLLLPLAAALAALLMAIAIRCRSFKEAQANATVVVMGVSLLPLVSVFSTEGEAAWHLWLPGLAQATLMSRVLKGAPIAAAELALPLLACTLLTLAALAWVTHALQRKVLGAA